MIAAEYPESGEWCWNAGVYEHHRQQCLELAEQAEARGHAADAQKHRDAAAEWSRMRDREQRTSELRQMNRRAHRGA